MRMGGAYLPISPSAYVRLAMSCMCVAGGGDGGVGGLPISPFLPLPKQNWLRAVGQPTCDSSSGGCCSHRQLQWNSARFCCGTVDRLCNALFTQGAQH